MLKRGPVYSVSVGVGVGVGRAVVPWGVGVGVEVCVSDGVPVSQAERTVAHSAPEIRVSISFLYEKLIRSHPFILILYIIQFFCLSVNKKEKKVRVN